MNTPTTELSSLELGFGQAAGGSGSGSVSGGASSGITCNCKKSRCLKLYCECFHALKFCETCRCQDCKNKPGNEELREGIIATIKERDPTAFDSKVKLDGKQKGHLTGCHCKRTLCLKKYCECFTLQVPCSTKCRCLKCQNVASLYEDVNLSQTNYSAATVLTATLAAIDDNGGEEALGYGSLAGTASGTASDNDIDGSSRDGSVKHEPGSPVPTTSTEASGGGTPVRRQGIALNPPGSPNPNTLLDLAGACTAQEKEEQAREGLLALSPLRVSRTRGPSSNTNSSSSNGSIGIAGHGQSVKIGDLKDDMA